MVRRVLPFWGLVLLILAGSASSGQLSLASLAVLVCFLAVMKVALIPLSQEYLTRYHYYVRAMRWLLFFMALSSILSWLMGPFAFGRYTPVFYQLLSTLITLGWTLFILTFLISATRVERNTLFAGLAVYLLLAATWAEFFELIQILQAGSFEPPLTTRGTSSSMFDLDSLYLSLSSLTTVGIAKIEPLQPAARYLVVMEAVVGNLYLAVMIARLVALHKSPDKPLPAIPTIRRPRRPRKSALKQSLRLRRWR